MGITQQIGASSIIKPGVCTSSTRPASPYEGQMIYTTDLDTLEIWNDTAWRIMGAATPTNGTVLQIISGSTSTPVSNSTTTYADTGLTATITPKSTTSKILVLVNQVGGDKSSGNLSNSISLRLLRGASPIALIAHSAGYTGTALNVRVAAMSTCFLDSPATTSATTYKTQMANGIAAASASVQIGSDLSTITLREISA